MSSMNVVVLIGRLTRDPDLQHTGSGTPVCNVSLAVDRSVKRGDKWEKETSFIDVAVWGSRGEAFARHHAKGQLASVKGYLQQDTWEDKNGGGKRSRLKVICEEWCFVGAPKEHDRAPSHGEGGAPDDTPF